MWSPSSSKDNELRCAPILQSAFCPQRNRTGFASNTERAHRLIDLGDLSYIHHMALESLHDTICKLRSI